MSTSGWLLVSPRDARYPDPMTLFRSYPAISARTLTSSWQYVRIEIRISLLRIEFKRAQFLTLRTFSIASCSDSSLLSSDALLAASVPLHRSPFLLQIALSVANFGSESAKFGVSV
jgi:hypothetical protein